MIGLNSFIAVLIAVKIIIVISNADMAFPPFGLDLVFQPSPPSGSTSRELTAYAFMLPTL